MNRLSRLTFLFALVVLWAGCVSPPAIKRLPAYDRAMAMAPAGEPRCLYVEAVDAATLPTLIPYASMISKYGEDRDYAAREIGREAVKKLTPDVVLFLKGSPYTPGVEVGFVVFPLAITPTGSVPSVEGFACRLAPVRLGLVWDANGMVRSADAAARSSGIIEGDTIASVAGAEVLYGERWGESPHFGKLLDLRPGDRVSVAWIRSGSGRMDGSFVAEPNPPTHLALASSIDLGTQTALSE